MLFGATFAYLYLIWNLMDDKPVISFDNNAKMADLFVPAKFDAKYINPELLDQSMQHHMDSYVLNRIKRTPV